MKKFAFLLMLVILVGCRDESYTYYESTMNGETTIEQHMKAMKTLETNGWEDVSIERICGYYRITARKRKARCKMIIEE